jgi:hypothetical protein
METLKQLQSENPNGLMQIGSLSIEEYRDQHCYFGLSNGWDIFQSKLLTPGKEDFYRFPNSSGSSLSNLFQVKDESADKATSQLVVFVVEHIEGNQVLCNLILSNIAWQGILADKKKRVIKVEQFYLGVLQKELQVKA